jgi:hypothetical protein
MFVTHRIIAVSAILAATPSGTAAHPADAVVDADPAVTIVGGTHEQRDVVVAAVDRFRSVGLLLPDLDIRIHDGKQGCEDKQGLFHREDDLAVIDLCFGGEFLALHELGHAWERFNLDDRDRAEFQHLTGATTWRSTDVAWGRRGAEKAANTMAFGLLSTPLGSLQYHRIDFAQFEALAGIPSPRIAEVLPVTHAAPLIDDAERIRLAAYESWRQASSRSG